MLDVFVASEGEAEVVMFSGGEPTIHKHILDFVDLAQQRPIRSVNLKTNGIRLASDRRFVAELGERSRVPGRSMNVYLQFDGFDERTHREIRGRDLRTIKRAALDNCAEAGLTVTLVAVVERGLNEHELGAIVEFGVGHPAVRSVAFQPVSHSGRHVPFDPLRRPAQEIVQEVFLRAWRRADRFDPSVASLRVWLFAIARNAVVDETRRVAARPWRRSAGGSDPNDDGPPVPAAEHALIDSWLVEEALHRIGQEHRAAIVQTYLRGRPYAEVAAELGIPVGTLGAYVLGHLDPTERTAVEAHLDCCPDCRAELAEHAPVVDPLRASTISG
ncbi:MAG: sigma-70 family RNA polymerase sigma factor, partial [Pseudonocardia sp.]